MVDEFWSGLDSAPRLPGALPTGGTGADEFWSNATTSEGQTVSPSSEVPDSPGNPLSYVVGMAKNLVSDVPEMLKGIWKIGQASMEDVVGGVQKLIPGEQATEAKLEQQGTNWGNIVRAAPEMLQDDYASRYGFHGIDEVRDQLYSNPLTYLLDALMVGGATATGARVAGKAGLMSDAAVASVRGILPGVEAAGRLTGVSRPTTSVMGLTGDLGKTPVETFASTVAPTAERGLMNVATNVNPVKRMIQNTIINKIATRSGDAVTDLVKRDQWASLGISPDNPALMAQAKARVAQAEGMTPRFGTQPGLRIARPQVEKFVVSRAARYISGLSKSDFYGKRNSMVSKLHEILGTPDGKDWELVTNVMGTTEWLQKTLRGEVIDLKGIRNGAPINFEEGRGDILNFGDMDVPIVGIDPVARREALEAIQTYFGETQTWDTAGVKFTTPHSTDLGKSMRGTGLVASMRDAPNVARELAARNNWQLLGVRNYLADGDTPWNGMHYFYDTGKGVMEVNIADQALYDAQRLASAINDHINQWTGVKAGYDADMALKASVLRELGATPDMASPEDAAKMDELSKVQRLSTNLQEEIDAASLMRQRVFDHPLRRANEAYDTPWEEEHSMAEKVDRIYNWSTEYNVQMMAKQWNPDWAKGILRRDGTLELLRGPYTVALNRAFMPQKLEVLNHLLEWGEQNIAGIVKDNRARGMGSTEDIALNIMEYLSEVHHLPARKVYDALFTPTDRDVARAIYGAGEAGEDIANPDALARITEMAGDIAETGKVSGSYRARGFAQAKTPEEIAALVMRRIKDETKMDILRGEVEGQLLEDWSWRTFAEASPQLPGYYPHIRTGQNGAMWWKGSTMKAPAMQFQKGFKGYLMESGRVEADVFKAYSFRAYQLLRHQELMDQFENLRPMARELSEKELMMLQQGALSLEGQVLFSPDFAKKQLSLHSALLDDIHAGMADGMLYEDAARDAIQGIADELQNITTDALANSKVYALPNYVADQFKSGFLQGFSPARMRMFWDKPRDLWISSVLGLNPRWFIYRSMGNIVFTGISNPSAIPRLFGWSRPKNNDMIQMLLEDAKMPDGSSVLDMMSRGYAAGEMQKLGFVNASAKPGKLGTHTPMARLREWGSSADEFPKLTKTADAIYNSRFGRLPRAISARMTRRVNLMEQAERRGIALGELAKTWGSRFEKNMDLARRVADEGMDEGLAMRLQTEANWVLGNYTMLSPLERDVVRRFLMPFYPFYRHMIKFATRMPWDHPGKSALLNAINEVDKDIGPHLPDYLGGAVYIGSMGGIPAYWNTTHWNPMSEISLPESSPVAFLDPRIRMIYQAFSGTDEFNRPYHADNIYQAPNGVEMIRTSSGWQRFEGIQHEPWVNMMMSLYGGPGSNVVSSQTRGYNMPWQKALAGNLGVTVSPYDVLGNSLRELEASQAAWSSSSAREVPVSYGR